MIKYETQSTQKENLLFKQQKEMIFITLSNDELDYIVQLCKNEIKMNEDLISDLKDKVEKSFWADEIKFAKKLIKRIGNLRKEQEHTEVVLQKLRLNGLNAEQEDYVIESQLEQIRARRENEI